MTSRVAVSGYITGALTLLLLGVLGALAWGARIEADPRFTVCAIVTILIGFASVTMVACAYVVYKGGQYVAGACETVDRLASVLPSDDPKIRRIG